MAIDATTPVVVLKSIAHGGLGVVRSLGRLGINAYTIEADAWTPAFYSRYNQGAVRLDIETAPAERALYELERLAKRLGVPSVIIPSTDYAAIFLADHYGRLQRSFIFLEQSPELLRKLYSKREMYYLAKQHGVFTAETSFPLCRQDVLTFLETATFPLVLKAIDGTRLDARCGKKMFIVNSANELLDLYDALEDPRTPNLMLQEYIAGVDDSVWMFNAYFNRNSECLIAHTGKKLRQCPAFSGYTSLGVCMRNDVVHETATRFLRGLNYSGLVDIDFRYDARDRTYKMLDVNPRLGATFRLFVAENDLDLARAYYLDMTGQRVPPASVKEGRKWIVGDLDFASSLRYYKCGQLKPIEWLASLRGIEDSAFFAIDDPIPFFVRVASDIRDISKRIVRKVRAICAASQEEVAPQFGDALPTRSEAKAA
jgi:D-aspartate ligase